MVEHQNKLINRIQLNKMAIDKLARFSLSYKMKRRALLGIMFSYDQVTFKHSRRVKKIASTIASMCGIRNDDFEVGAELHDIGKILIPKRLLKVKSYRDITSEEKRQRDSHIEKSVEILSMLGFNELVIKLAQYHETPFKEIDNEQSLYFNGYFLPSILMIADILISAAENATKYNHDNFRSIFMEVIKKSTEKIIQPELTERFIDFVSEHESWILQILNRR